MSDAADGVEGHADVLRRVAGPARRAPSCGGSSRGRRRGAWRSGSPRWPARSRGRGARPPAESAGSWTKARPSCVSPLGEEGADEVLLDVQVLVEELGEGLLVDVGAHPHHRELEEAGHGRRQHVLGARSRLSTSTRSARDGERVERARAPRPRSPSRSRPPRGAVNGRMGRTDDERRLPLAEEDLQDRGRGSPTAAHPAGSGSAAR